jgi:hypothetical protein
MCPRIAPVFFVLLAAAAARAQVDPSSLPAHDAHEGLLVAADPYQDAARYKARFGKKNPYDAGIVAIDVFLRNDNDKPIRLERETIRLLVAPPGYDRQRLELLEIEDVVDRILNKGGPNPTVPRRPFPNRGPKVGRSKEWKELEASLRSVALEADILPPRSTMHGVVFFDLSHHYDWLPYARLYLPDLKFLENNRALLFFEVDLSRVRPR